MDLILFLKLFRDDALRIGIGIEFHSLGTVYEYDLSNMEERDLGTAYYALLTDYHSVRLWVSAILAYTLSKISNWSPYIFALILKARFEYTKYMLL